ncbi:MAG: lanthionine synthetase C family protein [Actinomycetota bacterium]
MTAMPRSGDHPMLRRPERSIPMRRVGDSIHEDGSMRWDWMALRTSMTDAILKSATPERGDRLFPTDLRRLRHGGGLGLAHGAAGVLYALATAGAGTVPHHVDWLIHATRRAEDPHAGFYDGLHGVAHLLDYLGRCGEARMTLERAMELTPRVRSHGLFGGLAGIGLNLLHFAWIAADPSLHDAAIRLADRLAGSVGGSDPISDLPARAGLMHGFCGPALFFVRLYEDTADDTFLDLAAAALRRDLGSCETTRHGTVQVRQGGRSLPSLATGSAGVGLVIREYLRHRDDEGLAGVQAGIRRACQVELVARPGLFEGRAGLMAYLSQVTEPMPETGPDPSLKLHLRRLIPHALGGGPHADGPGDRPAADSMDLATGSAGVLLVLRMVLDRGAFLPFLTPRSPLEMVWGCGWWTSAAHRYPEKGNREPSGRAAPLPETPAERCR